MLTVVQDPDDIILGPPRMNFASATLMRSSNSKPAEGDKSIRDTDSRDRFNLRSRTELDTSADRNDRLRDGRGNYRRRGETDQDSDGWSTVKPRKSFGHENAERFHGRMGAGGTGGTGGTGGAGGTGGTGGGDGAAPAAPAAGNGRFNLQDRKPRDRDDHEAGRDRPRRHFDQHSKDKYGEGAEGTRRNGLGRGRSDPWYKENNASEDRPSQRERIDRAKSWRDRDTEGENHRERNSERTYERRWDRERDQRVERDPEWLDEPADDKSGGHTEEDFRKFMDNMKAKSGGQKQEEKVSAAADLYPGDSLAEPDQPKAEAALAVDMGPDRFFEQFAKTAGLEDNAAAEGAAAKEASKGKGAKSRFTSFFSSQEDSRRHTEPPTSAAGPPSAVPQNGATILAPQSDPAEKEAFQALLQKLQRQTLQGGNTPPNPVPFKEPLALPHPQDVRPDIRQKPNVTSPEPFQQYGRDRREDQRFQAVPQASLHDMLGPNHMAPMREPPSVRSDQMLQDLIGQRLQHAQNHGSGRPEHMPAADPQAAFLMKLIQNHHNAPEPRRTEEILAMPQPHKQISAPPMPNRELDAEMQRAQERFRNTAHHQQRQMMRGQGPPGLFDEQLPRPEPDNRPQPTQILQRPPPPGFDHQIHPSFMPSGAQLPPPQPQRPMIPPPGLVGNPNRQMPGPAMFNFPPPAGFPMPEGMPGPHRNMGPPPGFMPPPGHPAFMPPPGMAFQQGPPEGLAFPYDGRGMPPPGAGFRRQ